MDTEESIVVNGSGQDNEMKNFKKRTKNCFLMFCEVVLKHEGIISEPLNSSQESINENHATEGIKLETIENSTFNSDSDSTQNEMVANYDGMNEDGGDSFNSVTCFCGKPFAGRPMIECSGCLTWLHMSCAKVKRKNIPEFYYCDYCKSKGKGVITPKTTTSAGATASSDETTKPLAGAMKNSNNNNNNPLVNNGTISSNNGTVDGLLLPSGAATKPRKLKLLKKNSSSSESDSAKILKKTNANGKSRKIRQKLSPTSKKIRQTLVTSPTAIKTKASPTSSLSSIADFNSPSSLSQNTETVINGIIKENINNVSASSLLKSTLATNNNHIYSNILEGQNSSTLNGDSPEKYGGKKLKL